MLHQDCTVYPSQFPMLRNFIGGKGVFTLTRLCADVTLKCVHVGVDSLPSQPDGLALHLKFFSYWLWRSADSQYSRALIIDALPSAVTYILYARQAYGAFWVDTLLCSRLMSETPILASLLYLSITRFLAAKGLGARAIILDRFR